ncbi:hypothetical protein FB567DRAFT_596278 [Paraphoma chrysanthemicola]|uniref:BTB domain-containing protein n=1 Tax=Paraphoma chrysanthemicola TaxID=798071 RepID=A0A8K0QXD0_9PLEO|nr:hypothetical protein FB567DRAFT_596278 [Paraphoma chrysanthemicola]
MAIPVAAIPIVKEPVLQCVTCTHTGTTLPEGGFDKLASVLVGRGENTKEFQVHRGVLVQSSTSFQQTLANAKPREKMKLPFESPETFETVVYWLYSNRFWSPTSATDSKIPLSYEQILAVYYCADEHGMQALQNATLTLFYQKLAEEWKAPTTQLSKIYGNTAAGSPLRKLVVDFMAQTWSFDLDLNSHMLPHGFLIDVLNMLRDLGKAPGSGVNKQKWFAEMNESFCGRYHDHGERVSDKS